MLGISRCLRTEQSEKRKEKSRICRLVVVFEKGKHSQEGGGRGTKGTDVKQRKVACSETQPITRWWESLVTWDCISHCLGDVTKYLTEATKVCFGSQFEGDSPSYGSRNTRQLVSLTSTSGYQQGLFHDLHSWLWPAGRALWKGLLWADTEFSGRIPSRLVSSGVQSHFLVCDCDTLWLDPKCPQNSPKVLIPWHPGRGHCLILYTVYSLVSSHSSTVSWECFLINT